MKIDLTVTPKQRRIFDSKTRGNIFEGGIGSGKTLTLCRIAIIKALLGRRFEYVSFSYPSLRDVVLFTMREQLPKFGLLEGMDYSINKNDMIIAIRGTEILMRSPGNNPDSLRGPNIHDFAIDEAREFKDRRAFDVMLGRLRNADDSQWYIGTTTKGKNWVWHVGDPRRKRKPGHELTKVRQTTYENPFLPLSYIEDLEENYMDEFAQQELYAEYVEFGSGIIDTNWFITIPASDEEPEGGVRYWDLAVSTKTSADYHAGARATFDATSGKFTLHHMIHGKFQYPDLKRRIIETAKLDGEDCVIGVEEAGQQLGFIDDLKRTPELENYIIRAVPPKGDKFNRMMPWATRAERGKFLIVAGSWNKPFKAECRDFTADDSHTYDDQVDAVSGAHYMLIHSQAARSRRVRL